LKQVMGMESIGILCERVRVEEKQIVAALEGAGLPAVPVPPVDLPIAIGAGPHDTSIESLAGQHALLIDRCPERTAGNHLVSLLTEAGTRVLGAGLASTGSRLDVTRVLAAAGIPRPRTMFVGSEKAGLSAVRSLGYPSTLMPLAFGKRPLPMFDDDIAEAVLEHRNTLGSASARSMMVLEGSPSVAEVMEVMIVDGEVVATTTPGKTALRHGDALRLAEQVADVLDAQIIAVRIAQTASGLVAWDVDPAPEFRHFDPAGPLTVAEAIGSLVMKHTPVSALAQGAGLKEGARDVVLSV
jgi:[lysine-biosynthesis-protein LysW]---L-2-aminoadipate ligase